MNPQAEVKGADQERVREPLAGLEEPKITSVSETQIYNAECINADATKGRITPAGLQKLNLQFGTRVVSSALASVRLASTSVDKPYAYLARVCAVRYIEEWNRACAEPFVDPRIKRTHRGRRGGNAR